MGLFIYLLEKISCFVLYVNLDIVGCVFYLYVVSWKNGFI